MKILCSATYYHPHISGLTVVARTIAEDLAKRGHSITVLTSQYKKGLPAREIIGGVTVIRVPVAGRISKGPFMPAYLKYALPLIRQHDIAFVNLPATPMEMLAFSSPVRKIRAIPTAVLYHCDLQLPPTLWHHIVNAVVRTGSYWTLRCAETIVAGSEDYLIHSRMLRRFSGKTIAVAPPTSTPNSHTDGIADLRRRLSPGGEALIGFVGRWAAEKGLEYLVQALPIIRRMIPDIKVVCAGEFAAVGEENYRQFLSTMISEMKVPWQTLGPLAPQEIADFYSACDVTVLPSINQTESFGLTQVESMLCGTPVVATDLPGVRVPIQSTGMGRLVAPRNPQLLADAIVDVIRNRNSYIRSRQEIERHFAPEISLSRYEVALQNLLRHKLEEGSQQVVSAEPVIERQKQANSAKDKSGASLRNFLSILPPFHALVRSIEHRLLQRSEPFGQPLLDLGCGDGSFASMAFPETTAIAVDSNHSQCRQAAGRRIHRCVINSDATALPFARECFQTVVANCVIEHIEDVEGVLREVFRVLRPDGSFYFGVPSHRFGEMLFFATLARRMGFAKLGNTYADWFNRRSVHIHLDSPDIWIERLARHGFNVNSWEYYVCAQGLRAFDLAHYISLPHLLSRKFTGKWVVFPLSLAIPWLHHWLARHANEVPQGEGAYIFFIARKISPQLNGTKGDE
jgi:glycosyltransferase involved in cell wall biosynthesis/SAM-dependent methyltransferase